jgi:hypothetical protein
VLIAALTVYLDFFWASTPLPPFWVFQRGFFQASQSSAEETDSPTFVGFVGAV